MCEEFNERKKKNNNRESCFGGESALKRNSLTPETNSSLIIKSWGAAFFHLTPQGGTGACTGKLVMQKGARGKKTSAILKCTVGRVKSPLPSGFWPQQRLVPEGRRVFPQRLSPASPVPLAAAACRTGALLLFAGSFYGCTF